MQHDPNARTQIIEVPLPEELTEPLPADASPVTIAARTAAETALGVHGVHHLGNLLARAADTVRARFGRSAGTTGVQVDETDGELDVVVSIVVEYPEPVVQVADEVRRQVREAVAQLNFDVVSVDVRVLDVHGPFDDEPSALDRAVEAAGAARDAAVDERADGARAHTEASTDDTAGALDEASVTLARAADALREDAASDRDDDRE
ncbi:Asp23/Gls24 family envelope stress response protein [Curtobacterium sp. B18]|uniref:Asp23/Gls24 family envelope stress response protein n=1 Tax=Curtobacterium sp. B18 TaxID=95614 RepID=UPI000348A04F|nr:Asp23/Gls24 family envelope stress response protein [Curtobacterium sp. B18]